MIGAVCDSSVVLKWFHEEGEREVAEARQILAAHADGTVRIWLLDLTFYEVGNVLTRRLGFGDDEVAERLDELDALAGEGLVQTRETRTDTARLAVRHGLTFYDAAYWATARALGCALITADRELLAAGAGESPRAFATRHGLLAG